MPQNVHVRHSDETFTDLAAVPFSRSTPLFVKRSWSALRSLNAKKA